MVGHAQSEIDRLSTLQAAGASSGVASRMSISRFSAEESRGMQHKCRFVCQPDKHGAHQIGVLTAGPTPGEPLASPFVWASKDRSSTDNTNRARAAACLVFYVDI